MPEEIIRALGGQCVGLCAGAEWAYGEVERILPQNTCALIKSFMGFKLGKVCPYVEVGRPGRRRDHLRRQEEGLRVVRRAGSRARDGAAADEAARRTARSGAAEIDRLVAKLEEVTGRKLTAENLAAAIKEVNDKRRALQRLNAARKASPVPISGKDALLAVQVAFYDDVPRFTHHGQHDRRRARSPAWPRAKARRRRTRRASWSPARPMSIPNWKLHDVIEKAGGVVVMEEMCTGSRYYSKLVDESRDDLPGMLDAIADKYLDINCACFTPNSARMDDVIRLAKEYKADGIVQCDLQFCAPYQIEATLGGARGAGGGHTRSLRIDTDYSDGRRRPAHHPGGGLPGDDRLSDRPRH